MNKKIIVIGLFLIFFLFLSFNAFASTTMNLVDQLPSNTVGWKIQPPIIENSTFSVSVLNDWEDRTCYRDYQGLKTVVFFTDSKLNESDFINLLKVVWNEELKSASYTPFDHVISGHSVFINSYMMSKSGILYAFMDLNTKNHKRFTNSTITLDLNVIKSYYDKNTFKGNNLYAYVFFADHCGYWKSSLYDYVMLYHFKKYLGAAYYSVDKTLIFQDLNTQETPFPPDSTPSDEVENPNDYISQNPSLDYFSMNFVKDIINNHMVCEKATKICYYDSWSDVPIIVDKVFDNKPIYFSINKLSSNYKDLFNKNNPGILSSNETYLGVGNYISQDKNTFFVKNNSSDNYFIAAAQDGTNIDYLFFIYVPNFSLLLDYKIFQKIINKAYCNSPNCGIYDWLPFDLLKPSEPINPSQPIPCKYTGPLQPLCNFNIFDLEKEIGANSIPSSAGTFSPKKTYYLEAKFFYDDRKTKFNKNLEGYKLFESEKNNFNLSNNETAIFFSIIGGESSFQNNQVGDKSESIGLAQINKSVWRTEQGFKNLKPFLPSTITSFEAYKTFFDDSVSDLNKSLYLGLAVFKYNLNYAKSNINGFSSSKYTDIDRAFIMFYAHQFNITYTTTFFNAVNIPSDKLNIIINCNNNNGAITQESSKKRLGCIATVGSTRKIGWYLFYLTK